LNISADTVFQCNGHVFVPSYFKAVVKDRTQRNVMWMCMTHSEWLQLATRWT